MEEEITIDAFKGDVESIFQAFMVMWKEGQAATDEEGGLDHFPEKMTKAQWYEQLEAFMSLKGVI